jgi:maleylpyruvate isomerase
VKPVDDLAGCADAHARLLDAVEQLDDDVVRRPSRLPEWSVAHVLTHLARNADSHVRRFEGAARGEVVDQYPGGPEGREAEIEAGAQRPARDVVADLRGSIEAFDAASDAMPDAAWSAVTRDVSGAQRPASDLPLRRWQEVEVHHVDLGLGYEHTDWPDALVAKRLPRILAGVPKRLPPGAPPPSFAGIPERDLLAWCYSRIEIPGLPVLAPWA